MTDAEPEKKMTKSVSTASFKTWAHNKEAKTYLGGRTAAQWRKLLGFYAVYHSVMTIGVFAICYAVMRSTQPDPATDGPKLQNLLQPALVSYPNRVLYTTGDAESEQPLIDEIDGLFANNNAWLVLNEGQYPGCAASPYGYDSRKPCVYFRLNRVYNYVPPADALLNCTITFDNLVTEENPDGSGAVINFENGDTFNPALFPYNIVETPDQVLVLQIDVENSPVDEDLRLNVECQANLDQPEDELKDPFFGYKRLEVRISAPEPAE